jgi:hypothetical protein
MGRKIVVDGEKERLIIDKNGVTQELDLHELEELILSERMISTRSTTGHLSYSQLKFKSKDPIIVTSFFLTTKEIDKLMGHRAKEVVKTRRNIFEGIKLKEIDK